MEERNLITVTFVDSREINEDEMEEDEDIDQDDEDFDFSADGLKTQLPRKQIVKIMILDTKQIVEVKCRLLWTWKWMQAVIELWDSKVLGAQQLINGTFSVMEYRLNPISGAQAVSSISLFLADLVRTKRRTSAADDNSDQESDGEMQYFNQCKADFCSWIKSTVSRANSSSIKLECLNDLLGKYSDEEGGGRQSAVQMFRQKIKTQHAGHVLSLAVQRPTFFKASMIVYPKKIMSMLPDETDDPKTAEKKEALLDVLEKTTIETPWALGFSDVMFKATQFSGLEAPYSAISKTWFFPLLSNLHKNSLQIYDVFKTTCKEMGHTFLKANDLLMHLSFHNRNKKRIKSTATSIKMTDDGSYKAVDFLTEHEVLRRQVKGSEERFHLMRYWRAEEEICRNFATILLSPPWDLGVDVSQEEFARLHDDEDQMMAANSIVKQHITMISGRGGTGKTEVVSAVLKAAEEGMKATETPGIKSLNNSLITEDGVNSDDSIMTKDLSPIKAKDTKDVVDDDEFSMDGDTVKPPEADSSSNGPILYCAPTGKAASVIKKRVGKKAFTIHQILASYKTWRGGGMESPWKFATTRVVAVDECSMVSIEIFSLLIKYLQSGSRLQKVVLLGDHLQLPSVDPGNFMEDLYKAMITKGFVVNLKTNHRSEGSLIFNNATKISQQQMPIFDDEGCFRLLVPASANLGDMPPNARNNCRKLTNDISKPMAIVAGKNQNKNMAEDKEELYWALLRQNKEEYKIDNDEKSQMICFLNRECNALNQYGCFVYNNHLMWNNEGRRTKKQFEIGDKVMCTKNADIPIYVPEDEETETGKNEDMDGKETKEKFINLSQAGCEETDGFYQEPPDLKLKTKNERLMNGSVFKIRAICKHKVEKSDPEENETGADNKGDKKQKSFATYYVLDDMTGDIVRANKDLIHKKCNLSHAWALSIHKFQGSEADSIVYGVSGSGFENWRHVYTAVTRGKKNVVIVGQYEDLKKAVSKRPIPRQTALSEKSRKMISDVNKEIEDRKKADEEKEEELSKAVESMAKDGEEVNGVKDEEGVFTDSDDCIFSDDENTCVSPVKRKSDMGMSKEGTPPKRKNVQLASESCNGNVDPKPFLAKLKRQAENSPFSYKSKCQIDSPNTYLQHRGNPARNMLEDDDSFDSLDLTGIEEEAIVASQSQARSPVKEINVDTRQPCKFGRNCTKRNVDHLTVFKHPTDPSPASILSPVTKCLENSLNLGNVNDAAKKLFNVDEDSESETVMTDDDCDEDVRRAMAMSVLEQTRQQVEDREFEEAISNSQMQT